jgi:hypothetical protein
MQVAMAKTLPALSAKHVGLANKHLSKRVQNSGKRTLNPRNMFVSI